MQILFLGPPGAGKGTQCKRLAKHLDLPHLSSGDLLREAVSQGTAAGVKAKQFMDKGVLVPDDVLIAMFAEKLATPACQKGFILDGFPRNVAQAQSLDKLLADLSKRLNVVINLAVDEKLLTERITGRRSCSNKACATPYHVKFQPPKKEGICDVCGSPLSQRADDREDLVAERLKTYHQQTAPLIDYYQKLGVLETVDGNGAPDDIFEQIKKSLNRVPA
jgi:adenylate kinase